MNKLAKRKDIRLKNYDYSQNGAYFVTICVQNKHEMLGKIVGERIALPLLTIEGTTIEHAINEIPIRYPMVKIDKYIIMPNHIHMILIISSSPSGSAMRSPTLSTIVNQMKGYVTKQIGFPLWQRSYYDHIIRNEHEYQEIWKYIDENPLKWEDDTYCPTVEQTTD